MYINRKGRGGSAASSMQNVLAETCKRSQHSMLTFGCHTSSTHLYGLLQSSRSKPFSLTLTCRGLRSQCHRRGPAHRLRRSGEKRLCREGGRLIAISSAPEESGQSASQKFSDVQASPVRQEDGTVQAAPAHPGIYAFYSKEGQLEYIGLSRRISDTVAGYAKLLPDLTHAVKYVTPPASSREELVAVWKEWMQDAVQETGKVPPGNNKDNDTWTPKRAQKGEIKLTPGKGLQDLNCSVTDLVEQVVKGNKVVAFVKGTRRQPQCGFSYKVLSTLNELGANYEVLNVLDEQYNPGLREAIKEYSQWPTIPQLYVNGELVGGADIVEEMHSKGELKQLLS